MKILFTGASSFTGSWFVRELAAAGLRGDGHAAPGRRGLSRRSCAQARRALAGSAASCPASPSATKASSSSWGQGRFDLLAHHAADVMNYKSPDFDTVEALANNTRNLAAVLAALRAGGGHARAAHWAASSRAARARGSQGLPDFSPYALSKALTAQVFRYHCARAHPCSGGPCSPVSLGGLGD